MAINDYTAKELEKKFHEEYLGLLSDKEFLEEQVDSLPSWGIAPLKREIILEALVRYFEYDAALLDDVDAKSLAILYCYSSVDYLNELHDELLERAHELERDVIEVTQEYGRERLASFPELSAELLSCCGLVSIVEEMSDMREHIVWVLGYIAKVIGKDDGVNPHIFEENLEVAVALAKNLVKRYLRI